MLINQKQVLGHPGSAARFKIIFSGVAAVILSVGLARFSYTPLLPVMHNEAGLSGLAGGILATLNYIGYLLGSILVMKLKSSNQKFLLYRICLILAVVTTTAMAFSTNVYFWGVLRVISGLSSVAGMLLAAAFTLDWLRRNGLKPQLGVHFAGLGLGIALTGLASILMMQNKLSWDSQWEVMGLMGMLFFIPAWRWMPKPNEINVSQNKSITLPTKDWTNTLTFAYFCAGFGYVISATFIVAILEAVPAFSGKGSWLWMLLGIAAIPASIVGDKLAQIIGSIKALILSFGLQLISILIAAFSNALIPNLIGAILFGITASGIVSLMLSLVGRKFSSNSSAAMARLTISYGLAQIIAPAAAGLIAITLGGYRYSLWIAAFMMLLGIVALLKLNQKE